MDGGAEWIVDASGCDPRRLAGRGGRDALAGLFDALIAHLGLRALHAARWHVFPGTGGVTGLVGLSESHLACHSFPEAGYLSLNLYTCRPRRAPDWDALLVLHVGANDVRVRRVRRGPRSLARTDGDGAAER